MTATSFIYLRFITEKWSIESSLIRFATRSWCSHVEFVRVRAPDGVAIDTLGSRLKDGVQIRPYNYCKPSAESWFEAPNSAVAYAKGLLLVGKKYDWLDILGIGFNTRQHRSGNYICSSFVDYCGKLADGGWTNSEFPSRLVTPRDLLASPVIRRVKRVL
jgi:hypothetical protein